MSIRDIEQRIKAEIESEIAAIKAAGHNLGTNALVATIEKMWAYLHGDHRAFQETEANPLGLTDAELASADATAKAEAAQTVVESFPAPEAKPELVLTDEQKALISETPRPITDLNLSDEQKAAITASDFS